MSHFLSAINYEIFPPINAGLNFQSTVLLMLGFFLIKAGKKKAHQYAMTAALICSAMFLACYLIYHYGVGSKEFPREYPIARKIYLTILIPHIILAVVNLPLIIIVVVAAARGKFETHKRFARITFPSWLFVSVTGVIIYLMLYVWFPPRPAIGNVSTSPEPAGSDERAGTGQEKRGNLLFTPTLRSFEAEAGDEFLEVDFEVKNLANAPVRILNLESGCECLSVSIDNNPVPPDGKAIITGVFDIAQLRGVSEKKISVLVENETLPLFLTTRIEIDPIYSIAESMTTWALGTEPVTKTVTFTVLRESPIVVLSAESKRSEVISELIEVEKGRLYQIELTPRTTANSLLGIVRIETDCEIPSQARPLAYFSIQ